MKSIADLYIVVPLLLAYLGTRAYTSILLPEWRKKSRLRFSSVALPVQDIRKHELVRISVRHHDK